MAHTPGPWVNDKTHPEWERNVVWAGDTVIAHVVDDQHGNADANARLIAAAPELLACLQSLRVVFANLEGWRDMDATLVDQFISSDGLHRVDAAIAKATGKESE